MDEQRLISLRDEYQKNKDTYTPEQQEAMESKFWTLVQKAMEETNAQTQAEQPKVQQRYYAKPQPKQEPKQYRVTL